jgi:hypothetical protein
MGRPLYARCKHGNLTINAVLSETTSLFDKASRAFRSFSELCTSTKIAARFSETHDRQEESSVPAK